MEVAIKNQLIYEKLDSIPEELANHILQQAHRIRYSIVMKELRCLFLNWSIKFYLSNDLVYPRMIHIYRLGRVHRELISGRPPWLRRMKGSEVTYVDDMIMGALDDYLDFPSPRFETTLDDTDWVHPENM